MRCSATSRLRGMPSRTRPTTCAPRASSASTSQPPSSPVAPVTKTGRSRQEVSTPIGPHLPGRRRLAPGLGQVLEIARRVHALPVPVVRVHLELTVLGQPLERLALEDAGVVVREVVEERALEHEEAAVDVAAL